MRTCAQGHPGCLYIGNEPHTPSPELHTPSPEPLASLDRVADALERIADVLSSPHSTPGGLATMIERRPPTHTLTVSAPLNLPASAAGDPELQVAMAEAVRVITSLVRLGTLGLLCDQMVVTLEERVAQPEGSPR